MTKEEKDEIRAIVREELNASQKINVASIEEVSERVSALIGEPSSPREEIVKKVNRKIEKNRMEREVAAFNTQAFLNGICPSCGGEDIKRSKKILCGIRYECLSCHKTHLYIDDGV